MTSAESSQGVFGQYLQLFAQTEIFIFVFMEIVTRVETIQRVIFKKARLSDTIIFIVLFGLFSIFGTYIGIPDSSGSGAISNIRDLAPMVAGLVGGPFVGLAVGLIGGIHRFLLGGVTYIPCSMATILAGLIAGLVFRLNKGKLIGIISAIGFAVAIESMHATLALVIVQPFSEALDIVITTIPQMIVAVSLGLGISVIIIHSTKESTFKETNQPACPPQEAGFPQKTFQLLSQWLGRIRYFKIQHPNVRRLMPERRRYEGG